jgi:hypothetical protein
MTPIVKAKLDSILNYPFFSAVGQPLPSSVSGVKTWPQAARSCGFRKWSNSRLQARNALQGRVEARFPEDPVKNYFWHRFQEWNPTCDEVKLVTCPLVEGLVSKLPLIDKDRRKARDVINWDLLFICLETNFQDIVEPVFFLPYLDPWYAAGHFPCGWDGDEFPEQWDGVAQGKLIVY